jgi:hypothetical protein
MTSSGRRDAPLAVGLLQHAEVLGVGVTMPAEDREDQLLEQGAHGQQTDVARRGEGGDAGGVADEVPQTPTNTSPSGAASA